MRNLMFRDSSFEFSGEKSEIYSKRPGRPLPAMKAIWGGKEFFSCVTLSASKSFLKSVCCFNR